MIEWTIGCDLGNSFPIYPPTDKPWIAFISSSLLYNNTKPQENDDANDDGEEDVCDVTALIAIVQAISEDLTGVIMYQDRHSKFSYEELRHQTDIAIRDLAGLPQLGADSAKDQGAGGGGGEASGGVMVASPMNMAKRASPTPSPPVGGVTKEQILAKLALVKEQRAWASLNKNLPSSTAKLAIPGESPYISDVQPPTNPTSTDGSGSSLQPSAETLPPPPPPASAPAPAAGVPSIGVLAMGDPALIKILQDSTKIKGESVIAQLKFANNAVGPHQLPNNPVSPPTPTTGAERPAADRSLGLFFWIILGSVVLIVGVW